MTTEPDHPEVSPARDPGEIRRILSSGKRRPVPSGASQMESAGVFLDWSIKRLERRQRKLTVALIVVTVLLAATAAYSLAAPSEGDGVSAAEVQSLTTDVGQLSRDLSGALHRLEDGTVRDRKLRREVRALERCTTNGLETLLGRLRLLERGRSRSEKGSLRPCR